MVLWPTLAGFGFVVLAVLVIALGRESTKRYEYERNSVEHIRDTRPAAAMAGAPSSSATRARGTKLTLTIPPGRDPSVRRSDRPA